MASEYAPEVSYCPHPRGDRRKTGELEGWVKQLCAYCGQDWWQPADYIEGPAGPRKEAMTG